MKGIILAGGTGSRLFPLTKITSKQLLPIYNKQMVFYPLETLRDSGIREVLFISDRKNLDKYKELLGDGSEIGLSLTYVIQEKPEGLPQAFLLGEEFIGDDDVTLILGDNIFGSSFKEEVSTFKRGARIFAKYVKDPERFGVVEFNSDNKVLSLEEKPVKPKSSFAIPGLYIFDSRVVGFAKQLTPSKRGELEIIDIQKRYLEIKELEAYEMKGDWVDAGTFDSLVEAGIWAKERAKKGVTPLEGDSVTVLVALAAQDMSQFDQVASRISIEKNVTHIVVICEVTCDESRIKKLLEGFEGEVIVAPLPGAFSPESAFAEGLARAQSINTDYVFLIEGHSLPEDSAVETLLETKKRLPEDDVILICNRPNISGSSAIFYQKPISVRGRPMSMFKGLSYEKMVRFFSIAVNKHFQRESFQFMPVVPVEAFSYTGAFLPTEAVKATTLPQGGVTYGADLEYSWRMRKNGYISYVCYDPKLYDLNHKSVPENDTVGLFSGRVPLTTVRTKMSDMVLISRRNSEQNPVALLSLVIIWTFSLSILGLVRYGLRKRFLDTVFALMSGIYSGYKR